MIKFLLKFLALATIFTLAGPVLAYTSPGQPAGFVNDFAKVLAPATAPSLETELRQFREQTGHEIVVVTVKNLGGDTIENYANLLFRDWGLGKKELNNGLLFLIAVEDRKMRVEVGYGLEGAITDLETKYIQEETVRPFLTKGDYDGGVLAGVRKLEEAAAKEIVPASYTSTSQTNNAADIFFILLWLAVLILPWLASILARSKSWWAGGIVGALLGVVGWALTSFLLFIPFSLVLGLIFDYLVSKNYQAGNRSWWVGGGGWDRWRGGPGGRGGFGGFGGGSSGGGGSSSEW
jgi:uncharacterized protein